MLKDFVSIISEIYLIWLPSIHFTSKDFFIYVILIYLMFLTFHKLQIIHFMHSIILHHIYICTHTHTHTYIHTYIHACMHAYIHTYILWANKEDWIGRSTWHLRGGRCVKSFVGNPRERGYMEDLGVCGGIILRCTWTKSVRSACIGFIWISIGTNGGFLLNSWVTTGISRRTLLRGVIHGCRNINK